MVGALRHSNATSLHRSGIVVCTSVYGSASLHRLSVRVRTTRIPYLSCEANGNLLNSLSTRARSLNDNSGNRYLLGLGYVYLITLIFFCWT